MPDNPGAVKPLRPTTTAVARNIVLNFLIKKFFAVSI
jgi:hypothetical protein